jgi:hypothetical protein
VGLDFPSRYLSRMALVLEQDGPAHPLDMRPLGPYPAMTDPDDLGGAVEKARPITDGWRGRARRKLEKDYRVKRL